MLQIKELVRSRLCLLIPDDGVKRANFVTIRTHALDTAGRPTAQLTNIHTFLAKELATPEVFAAVDQLRKKTNPTQEEFVQSHGGKILENANPALFQAFNSLLQAPNFSVAVVGDQSILPLENRENLTPQIIYLRMLFALGDPYSRVFQNAEANVVEWITENPDNHLALVAHAVPENRHKFIFVAEGFLTNGVNVLRPIFDLGYSVGNNTSGALHNLSGTFFPTCNVPISQERDIFLSDKYKYSRYIGTGKFAHELGHFAHSERNRIKGFVSQCPAGIEDKGVYRSAIERDRLVALQFFVEGFDEIDRIDLSAAPKSTFLKVVVSYGKDKKIPLTQDSILSIARHIYSQVVTNAAPLTTLIDDKLRKHLPEDTEKRVANIRQEYQSQMAEKDIDETPAVIPEIDAAFPNLIQHILPETIALVAQARQTVIDSYSTIDSLQRNGFVYCSDIAFRPMVKRPTGNCAVIAL